MAWFPARWPPSDPERIQLYSARTPNGQKISIALEELNLEYDARPARGQSGSIDELYHLYGIDTDSIVGAAIND